jgi:hypothetical protein
VRKERVLLLKGVQTNIFANQLFPLIVSNIELALINTLNGLLHNIFEFFYILNKMSDQI